MINLIKKNYLLIIFLVLIAIPFGMAIFDLYYKTMPFWYDPARDFLLALDNQKKITLIGQTSGIPGLFYGPYWIWLISLALFVSHDPRVVQFIILTLPYFVIFPLILWKFRSVFDTKIIIALWSLFIFAFLRYTIFPWNPHLAPLLVLGIFYLLATSSIKNEKEFYLKGFISGILMGLVANFHISFSLGFGIGAIAFFVLSVIRPTNRNKIKEQVLRLGLFLLGAIITFGPFVIFESRHGFNQIKTIIATLSNPNAVVGVKGLTQKEILLRTIQVPSELLKLPQEVILGAFFIFVIWFVYKLIKKQINFSESESNTLLLSITTLTMILAVYLTSKNPVWDYHFVAVEIIFLMIIGLVAKKMSAAKWALIIWAGVIVLSNVVTFVFVKKPNVLSYDDLAKKEYIVDAIANDAQKKNYTVFVYNPSIYSFDYSYLFGWMVGKDVPYDPGRIARGGNLVYLVIQKTNPGIYQDYINSHAPDRTYKTTKSWKIPDGTVILKREAL